MKTTMCHFQKSHRQLAIAMQRLFGFIMALKFSNRLRALMSLIPRIDFISVRILRIGNFLDSVLGTKASANSWEFQTAAVRNATLCHVTKLPALGELCRWLYGSNKDQLNLSLKVKILIFANLTKF